MNHLKKLYKAVVIFFLQKMISFQSILCVFLSLMCRDNPIRHMTLSVDSKPTFQHNRDNILVKLYLLSSLHVNQGKL